MFAFVSFAFGAFVVSSQNASLPLNEGIFIFFFDRKLKIICFDDLEKKFLKKRISVTLDKISTGVVNTCFFI